MIVAVLFHNHDYEAQLIYLDDEKLDQNNPVDAAVLKALDDKSFHNHDCDNCAIVDAYGWDSLDSPFKGNEPYLTQEAIIASPAIIPVDRSIRLIIGYE